MSESNLNDLLCCPFCGDKAYIETANNNRMSVEIGCTNADDVCSFAPCEWFDTWEDAKTKWNTRAT